MRLPVLLLIAIFRLLLTWFGYRLELRGKANRRPQFVYLCRSDDCHWISRPISADDARIRCDKHKRAGVKKVFIAQYGCDDCDQVLVYPHDFDPDAIRHVGVGQHKPRPLLTERG